MPVPEPLNALPDAPAEASRATPLDAMHRALGARMTDFAGYSLPVSYPAGVVAEHAACRTAAALFDVSHMGQAWLHGADAAAALERLVPGDILGLAEGRQRYTLLMNDAGGIQDDLMVARPAPDRLLLITNASRKESDAAIIAAALPGSVRQTVIEDRALLALQGPAAAGILGAPFDALPFLGVVEADVLGVLCIVSRSGYTGEDGFEMSVPAGEAERLARALLAAGAVPAGLGARDSLRLEAGLCLYGNDIDELTSPVEAGLAWTVAKRRRAAWDFPGAAVVRDHLENGPHRRRVGLRPLGRAPARAGVVLAAEDGTAAGGVTSGGFSPTLGAPIAMGYVRKDLAAPGTRILMTIRGRAEPADVCPLPFTPHHYPR